VMSFSVFLSDDMNFDIPCQALTLYKLALNNDLMTVVEVGFIFADRKKHRPIGKIIAKSNAIPFSLSIGIAIAIHFVGIC